MKAHHWSIQDGDPIYGLTAQCGAVMLKTKYRQQSVKLASKIACTFVQGYGQTVPADVGRDCWLLGVWGSLGVYPGLPHPFWPLWPLDGLLDGCTDSV